jgi:hypothetical protein
MKLIFVVYVLTTSALGFANDIPSMSAPLFLKPGFSTVVEFVTSPTHVVIGDANSFQVERLKNALVIKTLSAEAVSNMLVYFRNGEPKVFILKASENVEPTLYKKIASEKPVQFESQARSKSITPKRTKIVSAQFDPKKDYLTIEYVIVANSASQITPAWDEVRITFGTKSFDPQSSWSERKIVQRDSFVRARAIFATPDIPRDLRGVSLSIPTKEDIKKIILGLKG